MVMHYAPPNFPFSRLFPLGIVNIVLGLIALALGVVDVVYNQMKFGPLCQGDSYVNWQCSVQPCSNPTMPWVLAAPGIWTGFFTMVAGGVSTSLMYASAGTLKTKRDSTGVLAALVAFPLGPATLVISALRLFYTNNIFYCMEAEQFIITDYVPFLMPILVGFTIFLAWCLSLAVLVTLCRRGQLSQRDDFEYEYGRRYRDEFPPRHDPYDSTSRTRRPYMIPDVYENKYYTDSRPRMAPWRDRAATGWREPVPYTRPYGGYLTGARSEPYPSFSRRYMDTNPYYQRGYYTTKTYNRYV